MLNPLAKVAATAVEPDRRHAPKIALDRRNQRCLTDTSGRWSWSNRAIGLLMLFAGRRRDYSAHERTRMGCLSGKSGIIGQRYGLGNMCAAALLISTMLSVLTITLRSE